MSTPATALRNYSSAGNISEVRKLLLEGVDPNVSDECHRTALSLASNKGHTAIVELLLANGAWPDPHEDYDVYVTPLMEAASEGHLEIVKMLVTSGANPSWHVGPSQATVIFYARINGHTEIVDYLTTRLP